MLDIELSTLSQTARIIAESNFTTSLLGALAGAWGGAYAAQRIASKTAIRTQLAQEMTDTNAAVDLAFAVCTRAIAFKSQIVNEMCGAFNLQQRAAHQYFRDINAGQLPPGTVFPVSFDFHLVEWPNLPADIFMDHICDPKLFAVGFLSLLSRYRNATQRSAIP